MNQESWLGLMIGNSRQHWSYFESGELKQTWNTPHISSLTELTHILDEHLKSHLLAKLPLYIASVVPSVTKLYFPLPQTRIIDTSLIPLHNIYPTMGIDRILALWGGGCKYGFPCLVIDSGTALTFTGADEQQNLVGGAILPGVRLQLKSLFFNTASLPEIEVISGIIPRWANNTPCAIQSGVLYSIVASIKDFSRDWLDKYPQSRIILTGGDTCLLFEYLKALDHSFSQRIIVEPNLIFFAMQSYRRYQKGR